MTTTTKYRHVMENKGHFAAFMHRKEPYGQCIPLIDRVLVTRTYENEDGTTDSEDMIVGTIIYDRQYMEADAVEDPDTKFLGYVDPAWLQAKHKKTLVEYEEMIKQWGREWVTRTTPVVVPAAVESLLGEADFDEEEKPTPPRRRRGR